MSAKCRLCNGFMNEAYEFLGFEWGLCGECRSVQKILDEQQYLALAPSYDSGAFCEEASSERELRRLMGVEEKKRLLRKYRLPGKQKLLDIGCGAGGYLLAGRDLGFDVVGVEPSLTHSDVARNRFDLGVISGYFTPELLDDSFDLVILSHVIEHILYPSLFLTAVSKVMKPGATLLIVTPNIDSISARLAGKYWGMLKPVDHVTMLGNKSIVKCMPKDMRIIEVSTHEWLGEPMAHIISAFKQRMRPRLGNVETETKKRTTAKRETIPILLRAMLGVLSFPLYLVGLTTNRQSCLTVVVVKTSTEI